MSQTHGLPADLTHRNPPSSLLASVRDDAGAWLTVATEERNEEENVTSRYRLGKLRFASASHRLILVDNVHSGKRNLPTSQYPKLSILQ